MRKIKFRGKNSEGKWIYGDLANTDNRLYIFNKDSFDSCDRYEVDPETVGQFTGLKDLNEKKIYENDFVEFTTFDYNSTEKQRKGIVGFEGGCFVINTNDDTMYILLQFDTECSVEVLGNIFDNPELIKGGEEWAG